MDSFKFNNLEELYQKLTPALNSKVIELKRNNINYINEDDIWRYLHKNYWQNSQKLTLGEMVNDILSTPNSILEDYMVKILQNRIKKNKVNNKKNRENLL
ncbi:MAG: post-transcriptional regulator [Bacilli bacterium]|nr:post-transcriptional regulator [Bacilli bacterium]